jgi:hypothetical protein
MFLGSLQGRFRATAKIHCGRIPLVFKLNPDQFTAIQSVVTQVGCQGPHPGSEGAFLVITGKMVMCSHESVLNEVFSILTVSKNTVANVEHRSLVDLN